ncbi:MAG: hypothetical protein ACI4AH_03765 [Muribaculaceae bacterium]
MRRFKFILTAIAFMACATAFVSCDDDDDNDLKDTYYAIVTLKTDNSGLTYFQVDKNTIAVPTNINGNMYNGKEVRALTQFRLNYVEQANNDLAGTGIKKWNVTVAWVDSILTKPTVASLGLDTDKLTYGDDPVQVSNDWTTVAEDGYVTIHFLAHWGTYGIAHRINLVSGVNPDDPFEFRLCHDKMGDTGTYLAYGMAAFNIKDIIEREGEPEKITITYNASLGSLPKGDHTIVLKYNQPGYNVSPTSSTQVANTMSVE